MKTIVVSLASSVTGLAGTLLTVLIRGAWKAADAGAIDYWVPVTIGAGAFVAVMAFAVWLVVAVWTRVLRPTLHDDHLTRRWDVVINRNTPTQPPTSLEPPPRPAGASSDPGGAAC